MRPRPKLRLDRSQFPTDRRIHVQPSEVHNVLGRHMLADGYELVLDLDRSQGSDLVDARDGTHYLDLFTFFASSALGMNHPALISPMARSFAQAAGEPGNRAAPAARAANLPPRVCGAGRPFPRC